MRVQELEKLMDANGKLIDTLVDLATKAQDSNQQNAMMFDKAGSMKNVECLAKAIQTAVQTQRDLFKLPTLDQDLKKKAEAQRKREMKARLEMEREKWEAEKAEKANAAAETSGTVWNVIEPEGEDTDG